MIVVIITWLMDLDRTVDDLSKNSVCEDVVFSTRSYNFYKQRVPLF